MASYIVDIEAIVTVRVEAESESAAEEMAIEAVSNMDGHEVVDVFCVARVRAAEAERDRLRALFDDAGQGEHDVLALVDHYQEEARQALIDREEAYPRALQAAADVVVRCEPHALADLDSSEAMEWIDNLANDILELSAAQIDAFAAEQEQAHRAESGEQ